MAFTKDQLIARTRFIIKRHQDSLANHPDLDGVAMDLELARIALAGMEAEPVAHLYSASFERGHVEGELTDAPGCDMPVYSAPQPLTTSERAELESARLHIAELEAAPPAPVGDGESPVPLMPDFPGRTLTQRECYRAGFEAGKALKDGWVPVPVEPTEKMIIEGFESEPDESFSDEKDWLAYEAMSGCQQAAHRAKLCWAAMIAAAPQQEVKP